MASSGQRQACPVCGAEMPGPVAEWPSLPFCSPRCKTIDLGRWLGEKYRLPGSGKKEPMDEEPEADDAG